MAVELVTRSLSVPHIKIFQQHWIALSALLTTELVH